VNTDWRSQQLAFDGRKHCKKIKIRMKTKITKRIKSGIRNKIGALCARPTES